MLALGVLPGLGGSQAQAPAGTALTALLRQELDRNFAGLKQKANPAPYYMGYLAVEERSESLSSSLGSLTVSGRNHRRTLDCSIRVGSPEFDNLKVVGGDRARFTATSPLPVEDDPLAIRRLAWQQADRAWRSAAQRFIQIRTRSQIKPASGDLPLFSSEKPVKSLEPPPRYASPSAEWGPRLRRLSQLFADHAGVLSSSVSLSYRHEVRTYVNTEGTEIQHGRGFARLTILAQGKATDGQDLLTMESFDAEDPAKLPNEKVLAAAAGRVAEKLTGQLVVQPVDPYAGPAILSGSAAGVFFHEIFGHRVEGHRQLDEREGQTYANSIGERVLPEFITVLSDATVRNLGGTDLHGYYRFDDEGVAARPVVVVDQGTLRNFLMSRMPLPGFPNSNGHGRKQPGLEIVPRQSNLIVRSEKRVTEPQLRQMLIEEIRRQGKPYGLYFEQVTGGFTTTQRQGLQAFTVVPLVVFQVFPDGRPDRLVRGVDIVGTPLASFAKILATADRDEVFNGFCGAESGNVPVSAVSPALLVSEIEVQRKPNPGDRPPLLRRPQAQFRGAGAPAQ